MDERREDPAAPGSHPPIADELTPVQAHEVYKAHANPKVCPRCSDIDRGRCETGQQLWRDWNTACEEAYQRLNDATH